MIVVETITERELQRIKKKIANNFRDICLVMMLGASVFGLICGQMEVAIGAILLVAIIFFIVNVIPPRTAVIKGNMKIIRRNTVVNAMLEHSGHRTKTTTIRIILAPEEIPASYIQTDTFMVYHSWGHPAGITNVTPAG